MSIKSFSNEIFCGLFRPDKLLAQTSRTQVWEVSDFKNDKYAAKLVRRDHDSQRGKPFLAEFKVYVALTNGKLQYGRVSDGTTRKWFSNIRYAGRHGDYDVLVMQLLHQDVFSLRYENVWADHFSASSYQRIACCMLEALKTLHEQGFVHRNVKPQNFRINGSVPYLVDFSNSKRYIKEKGKTHYVPRKEDCFTGTLKYASLSAHSLNLHSRKDDLISLGYSIIDMLEKGLPWDANFTSQHTFLFQDTYIMSMKKQIPLDQLCQDLPEGILQYMLTVTNMTFQATPDYSALKNMLSAEA